MAEKSKGKRLTRSTRPSSVFPGGEKKRRSGSTLSKRRPSGPRAEGLTIAIDGPSGAGKSTVAKSLAKRLGYHYVDTGAMYRSVALRIKEKGISPEDELRIKQLSRSLRIAFVTEGDQTHVFCNGEDVTEVIRKPEITRLASAISKQRGLREALVQMQREIGKGGGVVLEGRDIGTVVFPDAEVKFYLDAKSEERVRRRYDEMVEKGMVADFKETQEELVQRDHDDMHRDQSPLKQAKDAVFIDSTHRSAEQVVEEMIRIIEEEIKSRK